MTPRPLFDLYIACCVPEGAIVHFRLREDGTLAEMGRIPAAEPMYLAMEESRLYALLRKPFADGQSGLAVAELGPDGNPAPLGAPMATGGTVACHLSLWRGRVYLANYLSGSVARLDPRTGELLLDIHTGHGPNETRQEAPHVHFTAPAPDGQSLFAVDLGTDTVYTYDENLQVRSRASVPAGHGPRHLAYAPDGRFVYCANELGETVTVFACDGGRLTPVTTVDALPVPHVETSTAAAIRLRDGYLYVSHREDDSITVFRAEGADLRYCRRVPTGGRRPRDFHIFGDFLVCLHEDSDHVAVFRRQGDELIFCSETALPRPLCVIGKE